MTRAAAAPDTAATRRIVSEAHRRNAYSRVGSGAALRAPVAPAPAAETAPAPDVLHAAPLGREAKHALLARLHAKSNSGRVFLRDVGREFDSMMSSRGMVAGD